jgi:hypothetical protein
VLHTVRRQLEYLSGFREEAKVEVLSATARMIKSLLDVFVNYVGKGALVSWQQALLVFLAGMALAACAVPARDVSNLHQSGNLGTGVTKPNVAAVRQYPWHTNIIATTFWIGEVFDPSAPDGSQVYSTYDSQWEHHYGGCDGVVRNGHCETEPRRAQNGFFPSSMKPLENPFYLDLPFDDIHDPVAFATRGRVVPWAYEPGYRSHIQDPGFSLMKNRWVEIVGPNRHTCYGQIEDAGPSLYHDERYVFGHNDERPANRRFNGAGMDVSPALNGCLGFAELNGENDRVSWRFVERAAVPAGPWLRIVTTSGVTS